MKTKKLYLLCLFTLIVLMTVDAAIADNQFLKQSYNETPFVLQLIDAPGEGAGFKFTANSTYNTSTILTYHGGGLAGQPVLIVQLWSHNATSDEPDSILYTWNTSKDFLSDSLHNFTNDTAAFEIQNGTTYWFVTMGVLANVTNSIRVAGSNAGAAVRMVNTADNGTTWAVNGVFTQLFELYGSNGTNATPTPTPRVNTPPVVNTSTISPSTAFSFDNLTGICNATDVDLGNISYEFIWYRNGTEHSSGSTWGNITRDAEDSNQTSGAGCAGFGTAGYDEDFSTAQSGTACSTVENYTVPVAFDQGLNITWLFKIGKANLAFTGPNVNIFNHSSGQYEQIFTTTTTGTRNYTVNFSTLGYGINTTNNLSILTNQIVNNYQYFEGVLIYPQLNQTPSEEFNVSNISSTELTPQDEWVFSCRAYDGHDYSAYLNSSVLTIDHVNNTFNFEIRDEQNELLITENVTVLLIADASSQEYSTTNGTLSVNATVFGVENGSEYDIRYSSASYDLRQYFQTIQIDPSEINVTLYALNNSNDDILTVTVYDISGKRVDGALVQLTRYFSSCNCYNIVEMRKTSDSGEALFHVEPIDAFYRWNIILNGVTVFATSTGENFLTNTRIFTINIGDDFYQSYRTSTNVTTLVTYNNATQTLSYTYSDPSGITSRGCLSARFANGSLWSVLGPSCASGASGTALLTLPDTNNTRYIWSAFRETTTTFSTPVDQTGVVEPSSIFELGDLGLIMFLGLIVGGAILFSFSALAVTVWIGFTMIASLAMTFAGFTILPFGWSFVVAFISLTLGIGIFMMRR